MIIKPVEAYIEASGIKCTVYGGAGVGKTRLALTCPRPLYVSCEKGQRSLNGSGIPCTPEVSRLAELVNIHNWLLNSKEAQQYDTIIVDSVSELAENVLKIEKGNTRDGRLAHEAASENVIFHILNSWRDLPRKHVYMIAREEYREDSITKVRQFMPSMPNGKMIRVLPYKFDYLFRYVQQLDVATGALWEGLQCQADATAVAKDRSGRLNKWEPPNLGALFAKAM